MNFKEQLNEDLNIFFNFEEFGEEHTINTQKLNVIVDNEVLKQRNKKEYDGILQADILYYVKASDIIKKPVSGDFQKFDGAPYTVFDVKLDSGIYEVILQSGRN